MKKILIPIDFSENSQKALKAAKTIAVKTGAELDIMHTSQSENTGVAMPMTESMLVMFDELENSYKQQLDEYVAGAQSEGYQVKGIWESNAIQTSILRQATNISADLIVVGRTGQGTFIDKLLGSSSTGVALEASCPVLVVPPQATLSGFKNIIYATQFDPQETDILHQIKVLTEQLGAKLILVKVNSFHEPESHANQAHMFRTIQELDMADVDVVIVEDVSFIEGINKFCDRQGADLLIVSNRERHFLQQYLTNPSMTKRLVVETHLPLLVYHIR
ncbi:universal stress protein [Dyadobacter psychrophilus]|uniref:Nucleotide-binding universal stress protein, UspA family n=1 Tax=Dyadobacter psychrophilus TaxID=651661 RepID=A0A1T5B637_9BACT|nr:universal stress protein [Dyadobacter psychrophilus]SKB42734.1 Nucleotide-binding universal stress protein, UspA family [Dyadobacter psychrophilus]